MESPVFIYFNAATCGECSFKAARMLLSTGGGMEVNKYRKS